MSEAAAEALRSLLGPGVAVAWAAVTDDSGLLPEEAAAIARAVPARRAEFAAGRRAARAALAALGQPQAPILMGPDRAPVWPPGLAGSITHAGPLALAAVACGGALGIDLEPDAPLPPDLAAEILTPAERAAIPEALHRAAFAAKEAAFKALHPATGHLFGFDALALAPAPQGFAARLRQPLGPRPAGSLLAIPILRRDGLVLAALRLAA